MSDKDSFLDRVRQEREERESREHARYQRDALRMLIAERRRDPVWASIYGSLVAQAVTQAIRDGFIKETIEVQMLSIMAGATVYADMELGKREELDESRVCPEG